MCLQKTVRSIYSIRLAYPEDPLSCANPRRPMMPVTMNNRIHFNFKMIGFFSETPCDVDEGVGGLNTMTQAFTTDLGKNKQN